MKIKFSIFFLFSIVYFLLFPFSLHAQVERSTLQLRVDPAYFSPNEDNRQDQVFFYPVLNSDLDVSHWTLDIFSSRRMRRVNRLSGAALPALIKWDGSDKKGALLIEGEYVARLQVFGRGKSLLAEQTFVVDTTPPVVELSISTPVFGRSLLENGQLTFKARAVDASPLDRWLIQVAGSSGHTPYVFWSSGPVRDVQWDGTDQSTHVLVPPGNYRVVFQAWDKAGNESLPAFVDLRVNVTPREMLEHALHRIQVNETALGLIVQLDANALFQKAGNGIDFSDQGKELLCEASILANAYPGAAVKLDGYSRAKKNFSQDRDQASLYSWRVYSYMIKSGNVTPSRLTVRGRGRSAMFDRRAVGVPVLKNGVEVILEGNGPW